MSKLVWVGNYSGSQSHPFHVVSGYYLTRKHFPICKYSSYDKARVWCSLNVRHFRWILCLVHKKINVLDTSGVPYCVRHNRHLTTATLWGAGLCNDKWQHTPYTLRVISLDCTKDGPSIACCWSSKHLLAAASSTTQVAEPQRKAETNTMTLKAPSVDLYMVEVFYLEFFLHYTKVSCENAGMCHGIFWPSVECASRSEFMPS